MADVLTTEQTNTLAWLKGFRDCYDGKDRPASGHKAKGWDACHELFSRTASGGYGIEAPSTERLHPGPPERP